MCCSFVILFYEILALFISGKKKGKWYHFILQGYAIYDVENVYFYRRCKTSSFSLTHTFLPEKENCRWTCTKIHILCISVLKKTHIFYIQNFVELNISSRIFFRIFHLKYCFCRLSVIYLFHIKYFLRPPEKNPTNHTHTYTHPPTH